MYIKKQEDCPSPYCEFKILITCCNYKYTTLFTVNNGKIKTYSLKEIHSLLLNMFPSKNMHVFSYFTNVLFNHNSILDSRANIHDIAVN